MQAISRNLNQFLIENFNTLLRQEEKALSLYGEGILSIYEFHVIECRIQPESGEEQHNG